MVARVFLIGGTTVGHARHQPRRSATGCSSALLARFYGYSLDPKVYLIGELPCSLRPEELVGRRAATLVISWIATLYPSFRASRHARVEGLRYTVAPGVTRLSSGRLGLGLVRVVLRRALRHDAVGDDRPLVVRGQRALARRPRRRS
jgi:hypothetical protein